jgi:hypothetical protein
MRILSFLICAAFFVSCKNEGTANTFCDTTCVSDSFKYITNDDFESKVLISVRNCAPDSLSLTHAYMGSNRTLPVFELTDQDVRLNKDYISCVIKDTSYAWLTFNDCITGRGFLYKLPFNKKNNITKMKGALNSFDKKFAVDPDLRAYTDRGSIFVVNIQNGKEAMMTFKETYDIDFNKLHDVVDTINVTKSRIFVKLKKNGQDVPLEKTVDLQ